MSLADTSIGAMASPTASHATQEPSWPSASGGMTSLDAYLASTNLVDTAKVMGESAADSRSPISSSTPTTGPPTLSGAVRRFRPIQAQSLSPKTAHFGRDPLKGHQFDTVVQRQPCLSQATPPKAKPQPLSRPPGTFFGRAARPSTPPRFGPISTPSATP